MVCNRRLECMVTPTGAADEKRAAHCTAASTPQTAPVLNQQLDTLATLHHNKTTAPTLVAVLECQVEV